MEPSPGLGLASTAVRGAQDMPDALGRAVRTGRPCRQEPTAKSASGADTRIPATAAAIRPQPDAANRARTALWRQADLEVSPIIGHRGTAAVFRSALATARRTYGWLPDTLDDSSVDACLNLLDDTLLGREAQEAAEAALAVRVAFQDLLEFLVGVTLALRLLGAAWPAGPAQADLLP